MNKCLVTGASGFVGKRTCEVLRARGIAYTAAVRRKEASDQFEIGNLTEATQWADALRGCDAVIHLAARVHVMHDKARDPMAAFRAMNVDATLSLARQAAANGVKRLVFVSSVKVNGEQTAVRPFSAFDQPAPEDAYGRSKLEAENALHELARDTGLEVVVVRPPLVYGPGVRANFFRLMQLVRSGLPLPLGAVHNRRSLVALDNLVDLVIASADHPDASGKTFLVSDDHDVSIAQLLRMLSGAMGKRSLLLPVPPGLIAGFAALCGKTPAANRLLGSLQVDIAHTKSTLDWRPVISMQDALDQTVARFLSHH